MKITLSQLEIEEAVRQYVGGMVSLREGTDMKIDFTAGRGDNGLSASIEINYMAVTELPEVIGAAAATAAAAATTAGKAAKSAPPIEVPTMSAADLAQDARAVQAEPDAATPDETPKTTGKTLFGAAT